MKDKMICAQAQAIRRGQHRRCWSAALSQANNSARDQSAGGASAKNG